MFIHKLFSNKLDFCLSIYSSSFTQETNLDNLSLLIHKFFISCNDKSETQIILSHILIQNLKICLIKGFSSNLYIKCVENIIFFQNNFHNITH